MSGSGSCAQPAGGSYNNQKALQKSHSWVRVSLCSRRNKINAKVSSLWHAILLPKHHLYEAPSPVAFKDLPTTARRPDHPPLQRTLQQDSEGRRKWKDRRKGREGPLSLSSVVVSSPHRLKGRMLGGGVGPELRQLGSEGAVSSTSASRCSPHPERTGAFVLMTLPSNPWADGLARNDRGSANRCLGGNPTRMYPSSGRPGRGSQLLTPPGPSSSSGRALPQPPFPRSQELGPKVKEFKGRLSLLHLSC